MTTETWTADQVDEHQGGAYDPALYRHHGLVPVLPGPLRELPPAAFNDYARQGFLAVGGALDGVAVRRAVDGIDRLISGQVPEFRGIQWERAVRAQLPGMSLAERRDAVRKLIYFVDYDPGLHAAAHDPALLDTVRRLLGDDDIELFADQALLKPPGIGREKPWHQDLAFFDVRPGTRVVGVWIALDRAVVENGAMHVIPGSHRDGPVVHFTRRDFQICDADVTTGGVRAVPLAPGGALFFDGLLHHGTPANSSAMRRWALQFHYAPRASIWRSSEERAAYKSSRLDVFGADGKNVTC